MGGVDVLHPQGCLTDNLFPTPVKPRRTPKSNPNLPNSTRSENRKRSPPSGVRKNKSTAAMVTDPPAAAAKSLVMGHVKILKRGEPLDESLTVLNNTNATETAARSPTKDVAGDRKVNRVTPAKKRSQKDKRLPPNSKNPDPKIDGLKIDDFALSSTNRLGPDPEMVPKQMNKNIAASFAGSAFVDSPPPSSLPLPGFFTKGFAAAAVKEDPSTYLRRILGLSLS